MPERIRIALPDVAATRAVGRAFGERLRALSATGALIGLRGELGAGKTCFVGGVLSAFGDWGAIRSPTYTLIEPYEWFGAQVHRTVYHLDLYRLRSATELDELGVRELLGGMDVLLVEWIERVDALALLADVDVRLSYAAQGRFLEFHARTDLGTTLISPSLGLTSPQ